MGSLKIWLRVPDRSRLELSVTGPPDGGFVSGARLLEDDGTNAAETMLEHDEISPGPHPIKLEKGFSYTIRVRVAELTPDPITVTIEARILKPNGDHFGKDYSFPVTGKNGDDPQRATIIAMMEKAG
jgi:hypothetical protein